MFTRFSNPHALDKKLEIVSRNAISADGVGPAHGTLSDEGLLTELDRLVKRSLGDLDTPEHVEEKARKKRRKMERGAEETIQTDSTELSSSMRVVAFRLVSRTLPPKQIELKPKAASVIIAKEPPCEDNEEEAEQRRVRAQEAAIDMSWILKDVRKPIMSHTSSDKRLVHVKEKLPTFPPSVLIVEQNKPTPKPPRITSVRPSLQIRPSPHALPPVIHVPVIAVTSAAEENKPKTSRNIRRARARVRAAEARPPAVFWRPLKEWGIRAVGYSMGYEGSRPVFQGDPARYQYQRDTMRKGVYCTERR